MAKTPQYFIELVRPTKEGDTFHLLYTTTNRKHAELKAWEYIQSFAKDNERVEVTHSESASMWFGFYPQFCYTKKVMTAR